MSAVSEIIKFKGRVGDTVIISALGQAGGEEAVKEIIKFKGRVGDTVIIEALGNAG